MANISVPRFPRLPALYARFTVVAFIFLATTPCAKSQILRGMIPCFEEEDFNIEASSLNDSTDLFRLYNTTGNLPPKWHEMFSNIPGDFYRLGQKAIDLNNLPVTLGLAGVTAVLIHNDRNTYWETRRRYRQSDFMHDASDLLVETGDGKYHFGLAGAFALYGLAFHDNRALRTASQTVEAVLATGISVQLLKRVTGRESPIAATKHRGRWKFFPRPNDYNRNPPGYYAYPSGHISTAMATLTVIMENYPEQRWLKPVGYTWIGLLGLGLVAKGMHWYSDLPLGITLGYAYGRIAAERGGPMLGSIGSDQSVKYVVYPAFSEDGGSIEFAIAF